MKMSGFSAETSLGKVKEGYTLTLGHARESGKVLPQLFCLGHTCCQCWDEGGFSGCVCLRRAVYSLM